MDDVFKALSDPTRRLLLDRLFERDGQSQSELCVGTEMTRFGVMKHLSVLERAGLLSTEKVGRETRHYLNPVPIGDIFERWVGKFRAPWVAALSDLKTELEQPRMSDLAHRYDIFVRATPEAVWRAITDPDQTQTYFYGTRLETTLECGAPFAYRLPDGAAAIEGDLLEIEPNRALVQRWKAHFGPGYENDPPSRVAWRIEPRGDVTRLTLIHDGFDSETTTYRETGAGWMPVLMGLKEQVERTTSAVDAA